MDISTDYTYISDYKVRSNANWYLPKIEMTILNTFS